MNRNLLWRGVIIVAALAVAVAAYFTNRINLGLDLRGGMYLALKVETGDALRATTDKDMERLRQEMSDQQVAGVAVQRTSDTSFEVTGVPVDKGDAVAQVHDKFLRDWDYKSAGDRLVFTMQDRAAADIREQSVEQALRTIRNRIDEFGVGETQIQRQGLTSDRLLVQLPGVDDPERVKRLIKNTAFLEFRLVEYPPNGGGVSSKDDILQHYSGKLPPNLEILSGETRDREGRPTGEMYYAVQKRRVITGRDLKDARPGVGQFNDPVVNFTLTFEGGKLFGDATGANVGKGLAIVLDNKVVSAPRINSRITDSGVIEGRFSRKEVEDLSTVLHSGALPAGITYLEERTVGPSLGADSIHKGLQAGGLGALLVIIAMLFMYRGSGVNAVLALVINLVLIFGALASAGAALTLPGIAGIVLTIGIAVDANVLVFERIKEELRGGRTVKAAVEAGFQRALPSILDANICTLIAAAFLFQFGTGPVRGFAVTLFIGIVGTIFTAVFVSRWMFDLMLSRRERVETLSI